jgi:hypothetical protein
MKILTNCFLNANGAELAHLNIRYQANSQKLCNGVTKVWQIHELHNKVASTAQQI